MDETAVLLLVIGIMGVRYLEDHHKHALILRESEKLKERIEKLEELLKELRDTCVYLNLKNKK